MPHVVRLDILVFPSSRSEHIERVSAISNAPRISKIRKSGFISMRTCPWAGAQSLFLSKVIVFKTAEIFVHRNKHTSRLIAVRL